MLQYLSLLILSLLCISCPASGCLPHTSCACSASSASTCCLRVEENTPLGTVIGSATEIQNLPSPVTFTVQPGKINVSSNGTITVSAPLDRESSSCFTVVLTAKGGGSSYTPSVAVELLDENDNSPAFSGVFNFSEQETNGAKMDFLCSHSLLANDPDEGPNGTIASYTVVSPSNTFSVSLDSNRLCLNSLKALDRETNSTITIILLAIDDGTVIQRNGSVTIILTLLDTNDNDPVFTSTPLNDTLTVFETAPINMTIFNYTATDADDGSNARIFFHLSSSQVPFAIHNNGTLYVNGELNADVSDCTNPVTYTFDIIITNTDNVNDPMRATSPLTITIGRVVENPPDMSISSYGTDLVEGFINSSLTTGIYRVQNKECNTNYTAQIIAGSQYFQIDEFLPIPGVDVSGNFFLWAKKVTLDREETPVIEVLILFTANGDPEPLSTTVPFNVTLLDINDNPPSLSRTNFSVEENNGLGSLIDSLPRYFKDPDNGTNSTYGAVTQLTGQQWISVKDENDIDGAIKVSGGLDYESLGGEIIVNITLYDKGTPRLSSNITLVINLIDVNDNAPVFLGIFNGTVFNITENKPAGSHIAIIQAKDRDSGLNSNLTYSLLNSTSFVIDPLTGQLDSALSFDREVTSEYMIDILVTDGGLPPLSSLVSVKIKINDLNDNPPSFENETYQFYASTDRSVGAVVGVVQAVDPDYGENAHVRYRLTNHVPTYFEINSEGEISISETLPQEDGQIFNITVEAYNPDNRYMNATAEVQIIINFIPPSTPTTSPNSDSVLMYIAYGAPAVFIALLFAIFITVCLICCIRCYKHRSRDLYKFNDPPPPLSHPKKSSLRAVPTAGSRYEDSSAFYRKTSATSANGAPPKSPTVNFSDKSEVHYYSTEETMLSDATDGIGRIGLNHPPAVVEEIELSEPPLSPDHCTPTKATPPAEAETSLTARGVISSSTSTVIGPNSLSDDLSLSPGSINTTQELSHIYNKHSKGPPVLREDLLKKHDREYAGSSFPQAIVDEGSLSDGESTSDMVNHAPSRNMPRPPYHLMGGANGGLRYAPPPPPLSSEEPVLTTGMSSEFISHPVKPSHSLPPPPHSLSHSLPHPSRTHSNTVMYYPHGGSHAHNGHPSRNMYENAYPYKTHQPNHMNGSLLRCSSSTSSSSHNTSDFVPHDRSHPPAGFYRYPSREYRDMPPPSHNGHSADYHSNHGHSARTHMSHSPVSSSVVHDHSYPPHHVHPLMQEKLRYQQAVVPYVDGYSTDEDGTVASSVLDDYLQFEPPPLKHDFLSLSVDDIKLSSTDPDLKHGGGGGGGNRRNES